MKKNMRINFTSWGLGRTGGNRALFEVANRLIGRGHTVSFTSIDRPGAHRWFPLKAEVRYANPSLMLRGFRKFIMRRFYGVWDYDTELALSRSIPDCDVNVATYYLTAYPVLRSGKGAPFYYVQHYEPLFSEDKYDKAVANSTYFLPLKKLVVSEWLRSLIKNMTNHTAVFVGDGIDTQLFYPRNKRQSDDEKVIMSFFRGIRWKGDVETVKTVNMLADKFPNIRLLGVGNNTVFKSIIESEGIKVKFDFVDSPDDNKLAELYSSADIFLFSSWYEGFGLPPLEAMACGTPVVTTNCLGVREYAIDGYNALLAPPRDPAKMSEATAKLLTSQNLVETLSRNGIETARKYTWDSVVDRVEEAFKTTV